jgi:hypothetical protein
MKDLKKKHNEECNKLFKTIDELKQEIDHLENVKKEQAKQLKQEE